MKRSNVQVNNRDASSDRKRAKIETEEFQKLNQSDPASARRIQQRRRMVAKGKNTVGYDEYIKQVPKHKRRPRCLKTPSTPDHTLDIPNKRWQGLVKAWYVYCFIIVIILLDEFNSKQLYSLLQYNIGARHYISMILPT